MQEIAGILGKLAGNSAALCSSDYQQLRADALNAQAGSLRGYDCPECQNRGYRIVVNGQGEIVSRRCRCMDIRENLRRIAESGLQDMVERYTFEAFRTDTPWQKRMKEAALDYIQHPENRWFVVAGSVGSGKTHICTAICAQLMRAGVPARYFLWRDDAPRIKAAVNDTEAYQRMVRPLKTVRLLYIDDLFKGNPSEGDKNLAFEILDARYRNSALLTLISSERTIEPILQLDEAIGSRIYERAKAHYLCIVGRDKNQRL